MPYHKDTIAAIATAPGKGGVGIVRVSGPNANSIGHKITGQLLKPRVVNYLSFKDAKQNILDQGLALFFKGPYSFTGEDVLELQGHGGPVILDLILKEAIKAGARIAQPGEFSQRAFLNNKIDLAQAEAIADMIDAASEQAARSALKSLQGQFSTAINRLVEQLVKLRVYVEAAIDFPEEEIDFLSDAHILSGYSTILKDLNSVFRSSQQGVLLREGINIVIAGKPNAGKSSLLNALSGKDSAIVTHVAGTTRDVLKESIQIEGVPLHIIDTAGIRQSNDLVERVGIERALKAISNADHILMVCDVTDLESQNPQQLCQQMVPEYAQTHQVAITYVMNKVDLLDNKKHMNIIGENVIYISAKNHQGIEQLKQRILKSVGFQNYTEGVFIARTRHLQALEEAKAHLYLAKQHLDNRDGELLAEELRITQVALSKITGAFSADDLLGEIFSNFCIGK